MTEIFTLIAGAGGAILGSIITALSSRGTNKSRLQQTVLQEFLSRRLAAYDDVLLRDVARFSDSFSEQSCNAFVAAIHRACLVASDDTVAKLLAFSDAASDPQLVKYQTARAEAVLAMRADLWSYDTPQIKKTGFLRLLLARLPFPRRSPR